jgi:hypothetical protein
MEKHKGTISSGCILCISEAEPFETAQLFFRHTVFSYILFVALLQEGKKGKAIPVTGHGDP